MLHQQQNTIFQLTTLFRFRERDRIRQEMITLQDDVKTLHAQQKILEAQEKRQNKHYEASKKFEATHINLLHFYRTVYLGVEEIFLGAKVLSDNIGIVYLLL
jgi:hypothetical protein